MGFLVQKLCVLIKAKQMASDTNNIFTNKDCK